MKKQKQQEKVKKKALSGFLSVRGCPNLGAMTQDDVINLINTEYEICKRCDGEGERFLEEPEYNEGVTSFKIHSSPVLQKLRSKGKLSSDRLKAIIQKVSIGRTTCPTCQGLGIVFKGSEIISKEPIKEEKNVTKKRTRKSSK